MKLSRVIFIIAVIIVGVWLLGLLFKLAAWFISSLLYIAAIIVIIGLVRYWWESRKKSKTNTKS
jgi:predicted MFS family arabinose efflux permease